MQNVVFKCITHFGQQVNSSSSLAIGQILHETGSFVKTYLDDDLPSFLRLSPNFFGISYI